MGIFPFSIFWVTWLVAILGVVGIAAFHPFLLSKHNFSGVMWGAEVTHASKQLAPSYYSNLNNL
jgi:hypothetical protein